MQACTNYKIVNRWDISKRNIPFSMENKQTYKHKHKKRKGGCYYDNKLQLFRGYGRRY